MVQNMKNLTYKKSIIILFLITLLYLLPGILSPRDFWIEDEARYAEVLREMTQDGKWLVPHLNGEFYPDKPPIYFWLCVLIAPIFGGISPLPCLVITFLNTFACAWAIYAFAQKIYNDHTISLLSGLIFISTFLILICAQIVRMDMLLTWFVILSFHYFYRAYTENKPNFFYLFYIFAALGVLAKGPFGLIFSFFPILFFLIFRRKWNYLKRFVFHPGFLLFFLIILAWLGSAWLAGYREYIHNLFFKQIAGRSVKAFSHREPLYFYLMVLPLVLLPWVGFFPRAIKNFLQKRNESGDLLFAWFLIDFIIISLVSGKLFIYLLPMLPPLAIILGHFFKTQIDQDFLHKRKLTIESLISFLLTFGVFACIPIVARFYPVAKNYNVWPYAFIFFPLLVIGAIFIFQHSFRKYFITVMTGMWLFSAYTMFSVAPKVNPAFSGRQIGTDIIELSSEGYEIATFRVRRGILNFYANCLLKEIQLNDLDAFFDDDTPKVLILKTNEFRKQKYRFPDEVKQIHNYELANEKYLIITNYGREN